MRTLRIVGIFALLFGEVAARGEVLSRVIGPVELKGRRSAMEGPDLQVTQRFDRSGWITAVAAHVIDSSGTRRDADGIFCHTIFCTADEGSQPPPPLFKDIGVNSETTHLLLSDGQNEIRFPEGFGVAVASGSSYVVDSMLQSDDPAHDGTYRFQLQFDFTPSGTKDEKAVSPLDDFVVRIEDASGAHHCGGMPAFSAPAGLHSFETSFEPPFNVRVHYITVHLHRYAEEVLLIDESSGRTLFHGEVKSGPRGELTALPVYSSVGGLSLARGRRYVYRAAYRNPEERPITTMANMRLYFTKE